jgi:hypothetical protein
MVMNEFGKELSGVIMNKPKRAFVRGVWGNCFNEEGIRNGKLHKDVMAIKENPFTEPFVTYVFGKENQEYLTSLGFEARLINERSVIWDMETELYRHKLDIFKAAMDDFDEIVFLDWDCVPTKAIPDDFWDVMNKKAPFQANLFQYRTKKCLWRDIDYRKVTNGGFIYLRDKHIAQAFIDNWTEFYYWVKDQELKRKTQGKLLRFRERALIFDDEPAMSKYVDDYAGGWKGEDYYWDNFEPDVCNLKKKSAYSEERLATKDICFLHWG